MTNREIDQALAALDLPVSLQDEEGCEHDFDPDEGFHCLNCGKDGSEEVLSAAFDRAKDMRKYGH